MIKTVVKKYYLDVFLIFLLALFAPLFFYKLGQSSLVSWDEAWYAAIARNIINTGNFFELFFNNSQYFDHPPAGFWLEALSFKLLGISNFSARLAQALMGYLSLFVIYFLGKELFSRTVGFVSAIALASSFWFMFRARSGNLDVGLTFFFLLTLLLAFKGAKDNKYLVPLSISFTLLALSKTLVPFVILPALLVIFWRSKTLRGWNFKLSLIIFLSWFGSWFLIQILDKPDFIRHYTSIGAPGVDTNSTIVENLKLSKDYLQMGVGKWFWPGLFSVLLSSFLLRKQFLVLTTFFVVFFIPFIFSPRGQIWHLIPLHPILILSFFGFVYSVLEVILNNNRLLKLREMFKIENQNKRTKEILVFLTLFLISIFYATPQIKQMWNNFIDIPAFISDEEILGQEAGKHQQDFYLDDDSIPAAVFYSEKKHVDRTSGDLGDLFEKKKSFVLVTKQWRLDQFKIPKTSYTILKSDRDKILIRKDEE